MQYTQLKGIAQSVTEDTSAGLADVTSDPEFQELKVALAGKPGSRMGDSVIEAQPPDYKKALSLSTSLLEKSKHFEVLMCLCKAATGTHGFIGLAESLHLFQQITTQNWDAMYPERDADDPDDPWWERVNLLRELTDGPDTQDTLFRAHLVDVKHIGAFSKRDIDIANGKIDASPEEKERCNANLIRGAFTESDGEVLQSTDHAMSAAIDVLSSLNDSLKAQIGADAPSFENLKEQISDCQVSFREYAGDKLAPEPEPVEALEPHEAAGGEDGSPVVGTTETKTVTVTQTAFSDRSKVVEAFDSVILFYQEFEPSSPVPILLYRARQMVYKNFFDILRELAPQHQDNFRQLMVTLKDDPLSFLLEHSYSSFLNGEKFEVAATPVAVVDTMSSETGTPEANGAFANAAAPGAADISANTDVNPLPVITSREQVLQCLLDIQRFFEQHEPSSPVPLIVQKVRNLVPKNFLDLLTEFESVVATQTEAEGAA